MTDCLPVPEPIRQKRPNTPIKLYDGECILIGGITNIRGTCVVEFVWYPYSHISVNFFYQGCHKAEFKKMELQLIDLKNKPKIKINFYRTEYSTQKLNTKLSGVLVDSFRDGIIDQLYFLTFNITNYYWFDILNWGDIDTEFWLDSYGQLCFKYDAWQIILATLDDGCLEQQLEEEGGYAVTHTCIIKRIDNQYFTLDKAYKIIDAFIHYLSFVRGFWVASILFSGYNQVGEKICEEWTNPKIKADSWQSPGYSWTTFDSTEAVDAFPGFMKKWEDPIWHEVIKNSIQWYIESYKHTNGHNTSIVLVQAALEKLSWNYVKTENILSSEGFKKLTFKDQLRLLMKFLNVEPIELEDEWEITKLAKERNWLDTLNLINEVRNLIIHPQTKQKESTMILSEKKMAEFFSIGHYYLLSCLLKLFEYPYKIPKFNLSFD